jgi:hypothetical protein
MADGVPNEICGVPEQTVLGIAGQLAWEDPRPEIAAHSERGSVRLGRTSP